MEITKETRVWGILEEYGDIAEVMELFGIKRVGHYSLRALAARIHRVLLGEFPNSASGRRDQRIFRLAKLDIRRKRFRSLGIFQR